MLGAVVAVVVAIVVVIVVVVKGVYSVKTPGVPSAYIINPSPNYHIWGCVLRKGVYLGCVCVFVFSRLL